MEDDKKEVAEESTITLGVRDHSGNTMNFKVKKTTKFLKIFDAFAER